MNKWATLEMDVWVCADRLEHPRPARTCLFQDFWEQHTNMYFRCNLNIIQISFNLVQPMWRMYSIDLLLTSFHNWIYPPHLSTNVHDVRFLHNKISFIAPRLSKKDFRKWDGQTSPNDGFFPWFWFVNWHTLHLLCHKMTSVGLLGFIEKSPLLDCDILSSSIHKCCHSKSDLATWALQPQSDISFNCSPWLVVSSLKYKGRPHHCSRCCDIERVNCLISPLADNTWRSLIKALISSSVKYLELVIGCAGK